jgi:hypothetical protein
VRKETHVKNRFILALAALVVVGAGLYVGNVLATPGVGLTSTNLAKSTFGDITLMGRATPPQLWTAAIKTIGQSDVYVVDNKIAPGGSTGYHSHPGPSLILVVKGTVTNYDSDAPGCAGRSYSAGTGFVDAGGSDVHTLRNEGTVEAETIAVQFLPKDATRRIDKPQPSNCPS